VVNPYEVKETDKVIGEELEANEPSVIIARAPCALLKTDRILPDKPLKIDGRHVQRLQKPVSIQAVLLWNSSR